MKIKKPKFWYSFERYLGEKYPQFITDILLTAGFDNTSSLKLISEKTIKDLEIYVKNNKHLLKKTRYENNPENFEFALGHKILLTSIPENLKKFEASNAIKKVKKRESASEIDCNPTALKKNLIKKINNYSKKFNYGFFVTENNIDGFEKYELNFKCKIVCPFCTTKKSVLFKGKYWNTSNFTNHVRTHFRGETVEVNVQTCAETEEIERMINSK